MRRRYWRAAWTFVPYLRRYKFLAASSITTTILGAVLTLAQPWPFALLIGYVLVHRAPPQIVGQLFGLNTEFLVAAAVAGGFLLVFLIHGIAVINEWVNTRLDLSIALDFRSDLFAHCQELTDCFTDEAAPGDFIYRINYEAYAVGAMAVSIPPLAQSLLTLLGFFVIALTLDPLLALLSLTVMPFIYYSTSYYARRIEPRLVTVRGLEALSLTMVNTAMTMIHVVTAFNRQEHEHQRFRRQGEMARDARVGVTVRQTVFSLVVALITAGGTAAVLSVGAHHVLSGQTSLAALIVMMAYIASMYQPLEQLSHTISQLQVNCVAIMFSRNLLERQPEIQDRPDARPLPRVRGHLQFEDVSYDYPRRQGTLSDISFEVQPGEVVAVVGMTGAGKSTLMQLLPRFLDPSGGRILLDGQDLRDVTLRSLRDQIALVRQEPLLFPRSIAENIGYARADATMEEIVAAARAANAHDFIEALPEGYETVLGERGARVSGGERQRIALARAFLKDAPILILDEPTSSVDSKTEAVILDALDRLTTGRTTFIVAHRLSTVRAAARVLVLDHGRLVEDGSPAELRTRGGLYATITRLQTLDGAHPQAEGTPEPPVPRAAERPRFMLRRNTLVQLMDRSRERGNNFTGAIQLVHRSGRGRIYATGGELHSATGWVDGDELVIQAMSSTDEEFTFSLDRDARLPGERNLTMSYSDLVAEAARRQAAERAPSEPSDVVPLLVGDSRTGPNGQAGASAVALDPIIAIAPDPAPAASPAPLLSIVPPLQPDVPPGSALEPTPDSEPEPEPRFASEAQPGSDSGPNLTPGGAALSRLHQRNRLALLMETEGRRPGTFNAAVVLEHVQGKAVIHAKSGRLHHASGPQAAGDELVIRALGWPDADFDLSVLDGLAQPDVSNITLTAAQILEEAARRQGDGTGSPKAVPQRTSRRPSIVLLGSMTAMPVGGVIWQTVQYIVGFQRLGYDVFYVEAHGRYPRMLASNPGQDGTNVAIDLIRRVMYGINMSGRWCFQALHEGERCYGMSWAQLQDAYRDAAMIVNLHGGTIPRPEHTETGSLVYLETDPVQIQTYVAEQRAGDVDFLSKHDAFFSYGENYGAADCLVPQSDRFHFRPTRPPVVMEYWPVASSDPSAFTTIGNWSQHQDVSLGGETYSWSKKVEFLKFLDLPGRTGVPIELALSQCGPEDRDLLLSNGWRVRDALEFSFDAGRYRQYIVDSRAEFTVAKDQNVRLRSGWFSDRSATYLASGRPVVTQDTGFGNILPTGAGLFSFSYIEEAAAAIERIDGDYQNQRRAARRIAEEWFSSDVVLGRLLRELDLPVPGRRMTIG
ncbi:MAG TPA: ATP-binding cassette domain-containing protein [Candidatus Solibacter sp.]|jgi:ATP-binding cassette subfamily B protein|nr:ATP-binding cassette domain-containing protein [Candidatus Solibacter sp.]